MFNRLDEQCRKHLGKSCDELLAEAEAVMKKAWAEVTSCQLVFMDGPASGEQPAAEGGESP